MKGSNMNKIKCTIIQDILPLYVDDVVSEESASSQMSNLSKGI